MSGSSTTVEYRNLIKSTREGGTFDQHLLVSCWHSVHRDKAPPQARFWL